MTLTIFKGNKKVETFTGDYDMCYECGMMDYSSDEYIWEWD
jgi:hypothetical protein